MFHHLKITVSQLLEIIDRCNLFHFIIIIIIIIILYFSYLSRNNFIIWNSNILLYIILQVFIIIIIIFIYIDLMRKRCQLINVDVDVDSLSWGVLQPVRKIKRKLHNLAASQHHNLTASQSSSLFSKRCAD